jgi:hypothetical protein
MGSQARTATVPSPSEAPKLEVTGRGKTIASLQGNGNQQTKSFNLKSGAATFEVRLNWERPDTSLKQNAGNFEVVLVDQNNKPVETVIATIDYFDGARTINVPADGQYTLQIKAPGSWSVKIDQ